MAVESGGTIALEEKRQQKQNYEVFRKINKTRKKQQQKLRVSGRRGHEQSIGFYSLSGILLIHQGLSFTSDRGFRSKFEGVSLEGT